jgi:hypothetical protein
LAVKTDPKLRAFRKPDEANNLRIMADRHPMRILISQRPSFMILTFYDFMNIEKKRKRWIKLREVKAICMFLLRTHYY